MLLSIALAFVAPFAWGQVSQTTTTTTTTDASGTITEYTAGSAIVLRETSPGALPLRQDRHIRDAKGQGVR
jgi:hypothetical protein